MSTINSGPSTVTSALAFALDPSVSAGFIKTPKQINGCITWFDADEISTITTETSTRNVRYWGDKSNSNLVLTGGGLTLANEPLSVLGGLNGRNTMRFSANDYIYGPFTTSYTEFTIFLVMRGDVNSTTYQYPFSINNGTNTNNLHFDVNDPDGSNYARTLWVYWNGGGGNVTVLPLTSPNTNSDFLQGSPTLITFSHTNAGSGTNIIYANGRQRPDLYSSGTQTITIGGAGFNLFMGAVNTSANQPYYGDIGELIIYSRQLSAIERSQVHNYLANKWRIPLLQTTLTNRDLVFGKVATCQNNNIPVIDKSYRLNPANATGSPLQSNFYFADSISWMSSVITTSITLEAWVKPNSFSFAGTNTDLGAIMIANSNFYLSLDGNGKFNAFMYGSAGSTVGHQPSTTSVTRHAWNHVVWTFDGAYIRWYLNGVLDKTSSTTFTIGTINITNYLGIGAEGASTYGRMLDGYVAGCKIYGKALTASEILQNYEQSKSEFASLPNIVTNGLQFYVDADVYSSYSGSGTSWRDLSGNSYNSTLTNGPSFISTEPKCISFDGVDDYSVSSVTNIPASSTIAIWIRSSNYAVKIPISIDSDNYGSGPNLYFSGNYINWNTGDSESNPFTNSSYPDAKWHYIVVTNDSSTNAKLYIDGILIGTAAYRNTTSTTSNNFWIGRFHGDNNYTIAASISQVKLYNRVLSAEEVLQNYDATKFRFGK